MRLPVFLAPLLLLAAMPVVLGGAPAGELTPVEARGKRIYTLGTSVSGVEIKAALGEDGNEIPASALPCAGCHGRDGHGGKEGGVHPSDLTREALGRPAGGESGSRRRPSYDDRRLIRAMTLGLDSAGNRLHVAMPRYRLTQQDAADLLAYLQRLGHEEVPGLAVDAVHLGVLLPGGSYRESQAEAIRAALTARCAGLNRDGGLYGRRLALHFLQLPDSPAERGTRLRELLAGEPVFALIGADLAGAEAELAEVAGVAGVPLVSTLTALPVEGFPLNRYAFYLTSGLAEQAMALIDFAARRLPRRGRLGIVRPSTGEMAGLAGGIETMARAAGFSAVETAATETPVAQAAALADRLARADVTALLLLDGGSTARALLRSAQERGWRPLILLPGSLPGEDPFAVVPAALEDRLLVSLPALPPVASQQAALAAADVLIEGLKRGGREIDRDKLIAALETLYRFDAGLGTPVTFGPNRRLGARGAFVTTIDLAHHTLGRQISWIDLGP